MVNACDVIAYAYNADYHCESCTEKYAPGATKWQRPDFDPSVYTDDEGNEIHPVFGDSEWWEPGEPLPQTLICGDCGYEIDRVDIS